MVQYVSEVMVFENYLGIKEFIRIFSFCNGLIFSIDAYKLF